MRTAPRTPCAPVMTPTQSRDVPAGSNSRPSSLWRSRLRGFADRLRALLRLCLGRRFRRRFADRRLGAEPDVAEELGDPVGRQGADAEPMLDALFLDDEALGVALVDHRVVGPDLLDEAAVARAARVGDDNRIEGALLRPAAGQPDLESHGVPFV